MKIHFPEFDRARVLVVGDLMLDRYWHGATSRISPEAPVPVVKVNQIEERAGGAGNVALNISSLGGHVHLIGVTGKDEPARALQQRLNGAGVRCDFESVADLPTITKLRIISRHQQLIRLDFEESLGNAGQDGMVHRYQDALPDAGVVILSDYAKGTLSQVQKLVQLAVARKIPILVDPKGVAFEKYRGATLVTPNLGEFEAVVGECPDEATLVERGNRLRAQMGWQGLLVTRGEHGMTLLRENTPPLHLPAQAREVFDVTGAGDTVIATLAAALAAGEDMATATALANIAAGVVVAKLGTATVSAPELRRRLHQDNEMGHGVLSEDQLLLAMEDARAHGEKIVMTNGCFDILHAGHVSYLKQARELGDRLIVAVNDDASVSRLKGAGRPVNPVDRRMAVLAALGSVDWVVPFSEDTPERLICKLLPDLLVKGGDYKPEDIAGGDCVTKAGGEVRVLGFEQGVSTSDIIDTITGKKADS